MVRLNLSFSPCIILACLVVATLGSETYNTISMSGQMSDWTNIQDSTYTPGSDGNVWYYTWDTTNFYFAVYSPQLNDTQTNIQWIYLLLYFNVDPQPDPLSGAGSSTGQTYGNQSSTLPFNADFFLRWKASGWSLDMFQWKSLYNNWGESSMSGQPVSKGGSGFVEFSVPKTALGLSLSTISVCGAIMNVNPNDFTEQTTFGYTPAGNHREGYQSTIIYGNFYTFPLVPYVKPNNNLHINNYVITSVSDGDWSDSSTWSQAIVPTNSYITYISNSVTLSTNAQLQFLYITDGGTLSTGPQSSLSLASYSSISQFLITSDGKMSNNGLVTMTDGTVYGSKPITFFNINLNGGVNFGISIISGTLTLLAGSSVLSAPNYGSTSVLMYSTGTLWYRSLEWSSFSSTQGAGYPHHVHITQGTTVDIGALFPGKPVGIGGDFILNGGSATMNGQTPSKLPFTIAGNTAIYSGGTFELSQYPSASVLTNSVYIQSGSIVCNSAATVTDYSNPQNPVAFNTPNITASAVQVQAPNSITLDAGYGYKSYNWLPGGQQVERILLDDPSQTGYWNVTIVDVNNCAAVSNSIYITIIPPLSTAIMTTGIWTSAELTSSELTTLGLTTMGITTQELTTNEMTTAEMTTAEMTTSEMTTAEMTTAELTSSELTTMGLTTHALTTGLFTTAAIPPPPPIYDNRWFIYAVGSGAVVVLLLIIIIPIVVVYKRKQNRLEEDRQILLKAIF